MPLVRSLRPIIALALIAIEREAHAQSEADREPTSERTLVVTIESPVAIRLHRGPLDVEPAPQNPDTLVCYAPCGATVDVATPSRWWLQRTGEAPHMLDFEPTWDATIVFEPETQAILDVGAAIAIGGAATSIVGVTMFSLGGEYAEYAVHEAPVFQAGLVVTGVGVVAAVVGGLIAFAGGSSHEIRPTPVRQVSAKAREPNWLRGEF